jgi:hypothetical protein
MRGDYSDSVRNNVKGAYNTGAEFVSEAGGYAGGLANSVANSDAGQAAKDAYNSAANTASNLYNSASSYFSGDKK